MFFDMKQDAQNFIDEHHFDAVPYFDHNFYLWGVLNSKLLESLDLDDLLYYKIIDFVQFHSAD